MVVEPAGAALRVQSYVGTASSEEGYEKNFPDRRPGVGSLTPHPQVGLSAMGSSLMWVTCSKITTGTTVTARFWRVAGQGKTPARSSAPRPIQGQIESAPASNRPFELLEVESTYEVVDDVMHRYTRRDVARLRYDARFYERRYRWTGSPTRVIEPEVLSSSGAVRHKLHGLCCVRATTRCSSWTWVRRWQPIGRSRSPRATSCWTRAGPFSHISVIGSVHPPARSLCAYGSHPRPSSMSVHSS